MKTLLALRSRPLVLVVNDDEDIRAMHAYGLSGMGFDVMIADDPAHAQRRASEIQPDIIVAELASNRSEGWLLLRNLRRDPRTHHVPVVGVTAAAEESVRVRAAREGCVALCLKSCPTEKLASGLRTVLELRNQLLKNS